MKTFVQLMIKCFLFFFLGYELIVNLNSNTWILMKDSFYSTLIQTDDITIETVQNALTPYQIKKIQNEWNTYQSVDVPVIDHPKRKIYLYNTHQSEEYIDGITIFEVTYQFAKMLKEAGFEVIFETADFLSEMKRLNLKYNQLYSVSRSYLNGAFVQYGSFDLVIDVHRDSAKRSVSIVDADGITYGRLMFVIGNKSKNAESVSVLSHRLTDKMNQRLSGIMREPFIRQSVYNQDMCENMLLLEVGSDQNTSAEVLLSLEILVKMLKEEWIE
ncbi:MAG: stage II sporulation protein P [Erysipelotrichaceae bacterium]|nr:stage II sporulation protein P [Erysipelotrichaceae bacterium]